MPKAASLTRPSGLVAPSGHGLSPEEGRNAGGGHQHHHEENAMSEQLMVQTFFSGGTDWRPGSQEFARRALKGGVNFYIRSEVEAFLRPIRLRVRDVDVLTCGIIR